MNCYFREALGMTLHKDSKFYQSWQNFKDNNQFVNSKYTEAREACNPSRVNLSTVEMVFVYTAFGFHTYFFVLRYMPQRAT